MSRVTVWEWERGVRFRRGLLVDELGPGRYRRARGEQIRTIDMRPSSYTLTGQDVPTSDGVLVRVSLAVRWVVTSATLVVRAAASPTDEMHIAAQLGLRNAVLRRTHEELDLQRTEAAGEILTAMASRAAELGMAVQSVDIRDVVLPLELRRALLAELVARKEGQAALERARSETAALRSLLNAARLAEEHPALLQLRTLQAASQPGATLVFERPR
jgi:regulator of protease activity HflC (stomatin/prohibitin superfamily)